MLPAAIGAYAKQPASTVVVHAHPTLSELAIALVGMLSLLYLKGGNYSKVAVMVARRRLMKGSYYLRVAFDGGNMAVIMIPSLLSQPLPSC